MSQSQFLNYMRQQRAGARAPAGETVSRSVLGGIASIALVAATFHWWNIQSQLTSDLIMSLTTTVILVLAPPAITSFVIPWSPGGMLLQKINAKTYGYGVVLLCVLFFLYYSWEIQWSWWASQPVVVATDLVWQQSLVCIIGFVIIPALIWTPVSSDDLAAKLKQAHLVQTYEEQAQAQVAIIRNTTLRAQILAARGLANLTAREQHELAQIMGGMVTGMRGILEEVASDVSLIATGSKTLSPWDEQSVALGYLDEQAAALDEYIRLLGVQHPPESDLDDLYARQAGGR